MQTLELPDTPRFFRLSDRFVAIPTLALACLMLFPLLIRTGLRKDDSTLPPSTTLALAVLALIVASSIGILIGNKKARIWLAVPTLGLGTFSLVFLDPYELNIRAVGVGILLIGAGLYFASRTAAEHSTLARSQAIIAGQQGRMDSSPYDASIPRKPTVEIDLISRVERLRDLLDQGLITRDEYEVMKQRELSEK